MSYVNQKIKHGIGALLGRPGGLDKPFSTDKPASKDMPEALKPKEPVKTTFPEMKWTKLPGSSIGDAAKSFEDFTAAAKKLEDAFHKASIGEKTAMVEQERKDHTLLKADLMKAKRDITREALDAHLGMGTFAPKASGGILTRDKMKEMEAEWGKAIALEGSTIASGSISAAKIESDVLQAWHNTSKQVEQKISIKETDGELLWKADGQLVYVLSDGTEIPVKKAELPPSPEERLVSQLEDFTLDSAEQQEAFGEW